MGENGKRVAILVVAAMGLVACGGGSGGDSASVIDADAAAEQDRRFVTAAAKLGEDFALLGPDQVVASFVWAMERGYDLEQLLDAADAGALALNGFVVADSTALDSELRLAPGGAEVIEPSGDRLGVIAMPDDPQGFRRALDEPIVVGDFLAPMKEAARTYEGRYGDASSGDAVLDVAILTVLALAKLRSSGYDLDQIVEAVVLGTASLGFRSFDQGTASDLACNVLEDRTTGELIEPSAPESFWMCSQLVGAETATPTTDEGDGDDPAVADPVPTEDATSDPVVPNVDSFDVEWPDSMMVCDDGPLLSNDAKLTFDADGTVVASGSVVCESSVAAGNTFDAATGAGTWTATADSGVAKYSIPLTITNENGETRNSELSGNIDLDAGTVELNDEMVPMSR